MIYDDLSNWKQYFNKPVFDEIYEKLQKITVDTPNGEHFKTNDYYFKVMNYDTIIQPTIIESHRKEVDVQIILKGGERIKIYDKSALDVSATYSEDIDCIFYKAKDENLIELKMIPGKMAVFFPQDIHGCQYPLNKDIENIKKIVIKIDEKLFTH